MNFITKYANIQDVPAVREISARTFIETYASSHPQSDLLHYIDDYYNEQCITDDFADPALKYILLYENTILVGFARVISGANENAPKESRLSLEVSRIYLVKGQQGKGLGKVLLHAIIHHAKEINADTIWLGVWEGNRKAIDFYERQGFSHYGDIAFHMRSRVDRDLLYGKKV